MTADVVCTRLRVTDPGRWRALALAWRRWAEFAAHLATDLTAQVTRLGTAWSGAAATAATGRLTDLRRRLTLFRVLCWQADQAVSEFAAALSRARALLSRALSAGASIDDDGVLHGPVTDLSSALTVAERADELAADRLAQVVAVTRVAAVPPSPLRPGCTDSPAAVRRWWAALAPPQRQWLLATEPGTLAALDGLPAADRDAANRLLLDDRRADLDRALAGARGAERDRLRGERHGLDRLTDRLADDNAARPYLLRLDLAGEGRAVVALGDPDRAANVLTQVPGMTADLASFGGELARAERVGARATELGPAAATSAILWLDYDAPDFIDEAASARQAEAGATTLRSFQEGLRVAHDGPPARQTVLGHSYGSLVVGRAAAEPGLEADSVVFVGSPGVGARSAAQLHVPPGELWSSTARNDVIQWLPVSPVALARDAALAAAIPGAGAVTAFGQPERDLWFGTNPSDPSFGARVFPSRPDGGHLGYWDPGGPALDSMAAITLGTAR